MSLKQKIENNPTVWLISTLFVGFLAGFAAYQAILEVSGRVTVAKHDYESGLRAVKLVSELKKGLETLKAREGPTPKGHHLTVTYRLIDGRPTDNLKTVRLDEDFWVTSNWVGLLGKRYYEQRWEISDRDGIVAEHWHPFIPKEDGEHPTWAHFNLSSVENNPGKYRIQVFINDDRPFESREISLTNE